jgi:hypothetical protein
MKKKKEIHISYFFSFFPFSFLSSLLFSSPIFSTLNRSRRLAADGPATAHSTPPATRSPAAVRHVLARLLQPLAAAPLRRPRARPPLALVSEWRIDGDDIPMETHSSLKPCLQMVILDPSL